MSLFRNQSPWMPALQSPLLSPSCQTTANISYWAGNWEINHSNCGMGGCRAGRGACQLLRNDREKCLHWAFTSCLDAFIARFCCILFCVLVCGTTTGISQNMRQSYFVGIYVNDYLAGTSCGHHHQFQLSFGRNSSLPHHGVNCYIHGASSIIICIYSNSFATCLHPLKQYQDPRQQGN